MGHRHFLIIPVLVSLLLSCRKTDKQNYKAEAVSEWTGREILFPADVPFMNHLKGDASGEIPSDSYKILVYTDSTGCTTCQLRFAAWRELKRFIKSEYGTEVAFLFVFHPKNEKDIGDLIRREWIDMPIFVDYDDKFNKLNHFPSDIMHQTFLLDKDNKVLLAGNPIYSPATMSLYMKELASKEK